MYEEPMRKKKRNDIATKVEHSTQKKIEVESVFGHVKQKLGFRRLYLRGIEKVTI
ncbi:transposase [Halalkalibacter oceani]|uniref:transposase n=1 Tax=Halalkalibacter oceani TaxID=1653776 RepID=UPI003D9CAAE9